MDGNGPASRTRSTKTSSTGLGSHFEVSSQNFSPNPSSSDESNIGEYKTPRKLKRTKKKAPRTPSGQLMSSSVEDIRNFLLKNNSLSSDSAKAFKNSQFERTRAHSTESVREPLNTNQGEAFKRKSVTTSVTTSNSVNKWTGNPKATHDKHITEDQRPNMKFYKIENAFTDRTRFKCEIESKIKQYQEDKIRMEEKSKLMEQEAANEQHTTPSEADKEDTSGNMSVKLVMEMFQQLRKEIKGNAVPNAKERVEDLESKNEMIVNELLNVTVQLEDQKIKNKVLSNAIVHLSDETHELRQRIINLEMGSMRKSLVMSGMYTSRKKSDCIAALLDFFNTEMGIQPDIQDIFFLNSESTNPLVLTLSSIEEKINIMQNTPKLKGLVNENDEPFFFNDHLPQEINEVRRRERDIFRNNSLAEENEKENMIWKQGKLRIENEPYTKKVTVPTEKEIVTMSMEEMERVFAIKIRRGREISLNGSTFVAYTCPASTYAHVKGRLH